MTYPINEQDFVESWMKVLEKPDEGDVALAEAIVSTINRAYNVGKEEGVRIGINLAKKENKIPMTNEELVMKIKAGELRYRNRKGAL